MKNNLHKTNKSKKTHISFKEYDEDSRHLSKKVRTHMQQKANNALDKALRQKNIKDIYELDEYY